MRIWYWVLGCTMGVILCATTALSAAKAAERTFVDGHDRVLKTNTLRCGYFTYPPEISRDPNTGQLSGYVYDIVNEMGRSLNIKIEWTMEVSLVTAFADLKAGRFDAICSGMGETPGRAREVVFAMPTNYTHIFAWARPGDDRFRADLKKIDDSGVRLAILEGEGSQIIANERFPHAQKVDVMAMSEVQMVLEQVATKKADVAFLQKKAAALFLTSRPGAVALANDQPVLSVMQSVMVFDTRELQLKNMMDAAIRALLYNGFIESTFRKYDPLLETYILPKSSW